MKLWVRSQSKLDLICVETIKYCHYIGKHFIYSDNTELGEYATIERCIEIIDEIQDLLKLGNPENAFYHIHNAKVNYNELAELFEQVRKTKAIVTENAEFDVIMPSVITYEMPSE